MINFKPYSDDAFELYKEAVDRKQECAAKERLQNIEKEVEKVYDNYHEAFDSCHVHLLNPNTSFSANDKDLLRSLYGSDKRIVKDIRKWIDEHNKRTYLRKCPYCAINSANTTEHILPKEKYPEFAVDALNLLPCCSSCNSKKGDGVRTDDDKPYILNFYYDTLPREQYLFVEISIDSDGYPNFDYHLSNVHGIEQEMFDLLQRHFEKLDLLSRYKTEAVSSYSEIENTLLSDLAEKDDVDACLEKLGQTAQRDAEEYGNNHWKVVLKLALAESEEYKNYLLMRIK